MALTVMSILGYFPNVNNEIAILAQLVEHITRNDEVVGSIPTNGSNKERLGVKPNLSLYLSIKLLHIAKYQ